MIYLFTYLCIAFVFGMFLSDRDDTFAMKFWIGMLWPFVLLIFGLLHLLDFIGFRIH